MRCPFVGMDPFLEDERLWPWFQHQLAITLERILSAGVGNRYSVRLSERRFRSEPQDHCAEYIGIHATLCSSCSTKPASGDGRLVTLLHIASPAEKLTETG